MTWIDESLIEWDRLNEMTPEEIEAMEEDEDCTDLEERLAAAYRRAEKDEANVSNEILF
jgi:hypothetical protein